ncbi:MAG TPA: 2-oxo-hepta-3-ene-1,7-dioic acid hydratase [Devosia sp.]|nr:2-oxo-hepta-3-ene-1,7-dioic acid hydratase [Devosia sp.]
MLHSSQIDAIAESLAEAERTRIQIGLISQAYPAASVEDAYAIQSRWVDRKLANGRSIIGWKVGLTSKAMQQALRIDTPDSGALLDDMLFGHGDTVPADRFIQTRIEAEIAFIMAKPLTGADTTPEDVIDATEAIAPSLEILDTRVVRADAATGRVRNIVDTIADNAANAGIVLGTERVRPADVDMRHIGAIVMRDGEVEETGLGAGVLNNPAAGVAWLARRLASNGQFIRAGDIVLSGSFIRPIEAPHGSTIEADFGSFGSVVCHFA